MTFIKVIAQADYFAKVKMSSMTLLWEVARLITEIISIVYFLLLSTVFPRLRTVINIYI